LYELLIIFGENYPDEPPLIKFVPGRNPEYEVFAFSIISVSVSFLLSSLFPVVSDQHFYSDGQMCLMAIYEPHWTQTIGLPPPVPPPVSHSSSSQAAFHVL
jgi:hypothetical protein